MVCWGSNEFGQAGTAEFDTCDGGTTLCLTKPGVVSLPERARQVTAGFGFTCALGESRSTYCWGLNAQGQLGAASGLTRSAAPLMVRGPGFVAIDAGSSHACGVTAAGEVYCWGMNGKGEFGVTTVEVSEVPIRALVPRLQFG